MGVTSSRLDEDKALQLCRERKKFVRQALDGRCSLAAAHITYIQSLKNTGMALRKFVEPEIPIESSLYTSTSATPEPLALTEKSLSQFSFSSPSMSQRVDVVETLSPTPSPPSSSRFQANYMKTAKSSSRTVEERPSFPLSRTLRSSSSTPPNLTHQSNERPETPPLETPPVPPGNPPWDYFDLFHSIDNQFSFQDERGLNLNHELDNVDDIRRLREEEGIPDLEEEELKDNFNERDESEESDDEFDEPSADDLVRSFENRNRVLNSASVSPTTPPARSISFETEVLNEEKSHSIDLTPLKTSPRIALPTDEKEKTEKDNTFENKFVPKDFFSSIKEIEYLFLKASESGKEVPRMLEANKLHFRPILPGKEGVSRASMYFKSCFSCGEDPSPTNVPEEPPPNDIKYLTWHRTASSRSSSSRNLLGSTSKDGMEDMASNLFNTYCMNSGSHASTLDRLFAWERKLYDEVKASGIIRREYDIKCKELRQLESKEERRYKSDKTRAIVKDLHSRIRVAIHRIDSISKRIEELRDKELQPQLEELIEGLSRMWETMFECHALQLNIISVAHNNANNKVSIHSESYRQATIHLGDELHTLSSSFTKWVTTKKCYVRAIKGWLYKCVSLEQKYTRRRRKLPAPPLRNLRPPPIYATCDVWLEKLEGLPSKEVADSIKVLAMDTTRLLPHQEKNQGKNSSRAFLSSLKDETSTEAVPDKPSDEAIQDWNSGFFRFQSSLLSFLESLNKFADSSVEMYGEVKNAIQQAKSSYDPATVNSHS